MLLRFQSPRGDFGFLKGRRTGHGDAHPQVGVFQSPRGDFGFLKRDNSPPPRTPRRRFQSPRGDFGFLKRSTQPPDRFGITIGFNPLAGILVF